MILVPPSSIRTYTFVLTAIGSFPSGWIDVDGASCETTVIASLDGHRNVLQLEDGNAGAVARLKRTFTQGLNTIIELWVTKDSIAADTNGHVLIEEGGTNIVYLRFEADDLKDHSDGSSIKADFLVANTLFHIKLILDDTANTYDCYVNGVLARADIAYINNTTSGVSRIDFSTDIVDTGYKFFIDAIGFSSDPAYTVGDNSVGWELSNHPWQNQVYLLPK